MNQFYDAAPWPDVAVVIRWVLDAIVCENRPLRDVSAPDRGATSPPGEEPFANAATGRRCTCGTVCPPCGTRQPPGRGPRIPPRLPYFPNRRTSGAAPSAA